MFCCFQIDDLTPNPSVPSQAVGKFSATAYTSIESFNLTLCSWYYTIVLSKSQEILTMWVNVKKI